MIDTQKTMSNFTFALLMCAVYVPIIVGAVWLLGGKYIRRWWRRRKLTIPNEEQNVKTITGPLWDVSWIKVSEAKEKRPDEQRSTVLGNTLPEVIAVLTTKYGDEFDEKNIRSAEKRSYMSVLVGIPEAQEEAKQ